MPKEDSRMKQNKFIVLAFIILLIILSCAPKKLTETEKTEIIADVRSTFDNFYDDIRRFGLTAEFRYLDNSPEFFWVPPGYSEAISYDSVAAVLKRDASKYMLVDNSLHTLRVIPVSKEYAVYTGRLTSIITDHTGMTTTFSLVETGMMVKRHDGWKLLSGQTSVLE